MKWSVYKVIRTGRKSEIVGLGHVNAPDAPRALAAAWKRWPDQMDETQRQRGFFCEIWKLDRRSLGRQPATTTTPNGGSNG